MFGKSAFGNTGGFGQQPQQTNSVFGQQPQQQQPTAFGGFGATSTPSAFGTTPAATTSAFGQPAQQTSAFGAAPATGGFGNTTSAFGQARPSAFGNPTPSAFGAAQPATTSAFGGGATTAFGAAPATTSAFGSTTTQNTGGLFGQRPATNAFGGTTTTNTFGQPQQAAGGAFGAAAGGAFGQQQGVTSGTISPDFAPTQDRDITTGINNFFQTITAMPQYKNYSLEELRLQDYAQGRKNAGAAGAATGGAFGQPAANTFGQSTGAFGQTNAGGAFGQTNSGGAFGQTNTGGAFGQTNTGGLFGQTNTPNAFGQPAASAAPATGAFGQTGGAFGQTTGAFGQPAAAAKPFSFGSAPAATTNVFGQPAATTSAFGQPAATTNAFGQPTAATGGFGAGAFGAKPSTTTTGFGGFGQPAAQTTGFGQPATSKPATTFSFGAPPAAGTNTLGGFGQTNTTGFGQPAAGGFGQPATSTAATGGFGAPGGLFGAAKPAAPTTSIFGNTGATMTTGFGGFGQPAAGATTGGLFGQQQKPALGLGATSGGLFGNTVTGGFGTATGGFGQQTAPNSYSLPTQGGLTSFGTNPLQQQPLIATVDSNPYGNNPLFDLSKTGTAAASASKSSAAVATSSGNNNDNRNHYPIPPRVVSRIKLRGFSFGSTKYNRASSTKKTVGSSSLQGIPDDAVLGVGAYAPRTNKKLLFDTTVDTDNVVALVKDNNLTKKRVLFDPDREFKASQQDYSIATTTTTTVVNETTTTTTTVESNADDNNNNSLNMATSSQALQNGYFMSPTLETLQGMSKEQLKQVKNFIVGRRGYGEVRFDEPVDLSEINLHQIMGHIVVVTEKKLTVYPDHTIKPATGSELNVPALVKLENCFTHDKNTGAVIKDPSHPRFQLFKEKMLKREDVNTIDYDDKTGTWSFKATEF